MNYTEFIVAGVIVVAFCVVTAIHPPYRNNIFRQGGS